MATNLYGAGKDEMSPPRRAANSHFLASQEPTDEQLQRIEDELQEELFDEYDDEYPSKTIH